MAKRRILVIEDDPGIRNNVALMLKLERFEVATAEHGKAGVEVAGKFLPELVLCDINMPQLDGFGVLEALRADARFADTPFIFLTAMQDRANVRRGMNLGADDYLTKPFTRDELVGAVQARLKKHADASAAVEHRLLTGKEGLTERFLGEIGGAQERAPAQPAPAASAERMAGAVLYVGIRNFAAYSERLTASETAELLNTAFAKLCEPVVGLDGRVVKLLGDAFIALFEAAGDQLPGANARRAVRAAIAVQRAAQHFDAWIAGRHAQAGLPPFTVGAALAAGEVLMSRIGASGHEELTPVGDAVDLAAGMEQRARRIGWAVTATDGVIAAAGQSVRVGAQQDLELRGRSSATPAREVLGIQGDAAGTGPLELPADLLAAVAENARAAAAASKAALDITLRMTGEDLGRHGGRLTIRGYRVGERIGQGGSSVVYLAERESDAAQVVLKILNAEHGEDEEAMQRFIREFDIISKIDHPNVVKIHDRGFSGNHAYIAMEHFSGGTLSTLIAEGMSGRQALSLLAQAASALRAIHGMGVLHRDIKPANLMARADGTIALADFGIAKQMGQADTGNQGQLLGTPYYISPEQILGQPATVRSDLYALGIIFFEMLMRRRPFEADAVPELIALHVTAPRPRLPAELHEYQELLDRMLAIDPGERYPDADALLEAIDRVWTQQALRAMR